MKKPEPYNLGTPAEFYKKYNAYMRQIIKEQEERAAKRSSMKKAQEKMRAK